MKTMREVFVELCSQIQGFGSGNFTPNKNGNKDIDQALAEMKEILTDAVFINVIEMALSKKISNQTAYGMGFIKCRSQVLTNIEKVCE